MELWRVKERLEALDKSANKRESRKNDPVDIVWSYEHTADQEVVALIASCLAYGRVQLLRQAILSLLEMMGESPYQFVMENELSDYRNRIVNFKYRMCDGEDVAQLLVGVKAGLRAKGSMYALFVAHDKADERDLRAGLTEFVRALRSASGSSRAGFLHMLPDPGLGGACKRLNLMLRWLVRGPDEIDLGLWGGLGAHRLTIPLDTHIQRITRYIGISTRRTPDWQAAREITENLKVLCPEDPLKYDFALCHLGISGECPQRRDIKICNRCQLQSICQLYNCQ